MTTPAMEFQVITNQPSATKPPVPPDETDPLNIVPVPLKEPTCPQNAEIKSQNPHQMPLTQDDQLIGPLNSSDEDTIPLNVAKDALNRSMKQLNTASEVANKVTNSAKEAVTIPKKSKPGTNEKCRNYNINGPNLNPGAGSNIGLSLCLMQFCNICTACFSDCCNEYYNWCCCCYIDSELCVSCCTGCMECCAQCGCGVCCN